MHRRPRHASRGDAFVAGVTPAPGPSPTTRPRYWTTGEATDEASGRATADGASGKATEETT
ncbi:hypothetical protein [Halobaculum rubrum]|uniref:hypothetical protein n=1 Tax=Halobaculum rubrum TaxID=2872158 RepID=UPI001CA3B56B|nr:hypothetical protein [Halobaculum rubrum]QZY00707.1 hypothetical protein K6T25_06435 [Halobaculum rubrum]